MQQGEHEIISDDGLMQLYFTQVDASNELLPAHWHEHLEMICMQHGAMTAYINETSYELQQGDILVVNPVSYTHLLCLRLVSLLLHAKCFTAAPMCCD